MSLLRNERQQQQNPPEITYIVLFFVHSFIHKFVQCLAGMPRFTYYTPVERERERKKTHCDSENGTAK